jgi:DNA polymerase III epsilon subunit-like protein
VAISNNFICIYDYETTGLNPEEVFPVEIAAAIIHPRKLELVNNATFWSFCRPPNVDTITQELWEFHAKANQCTVEEIKKKIYDAPPLEQVFKDFAMFLGNYQAEGTKRKSKFSAPILAGHNTDNYDNVITKRLCKMYGFCDKNGEQNIVHPRDTIDLMKICTLFFSGSARPERYSFDCLREYFGLEVEGGHTAITDVEQIGSVIIRFLKYFREIAARTNFEGSFVNAKS